MARLSAEEKAMLARLLEAEDEGDDEEEEAPEEEHDEFTYNGRKYRYVPEDVEEVREEQAKPDKPVRSSAQKVDAKSPVKRTLKPKSEPEPEPDPEPAARRFHT